MGELGAAFRRPQRVGDQFAAFGIDVGALLEQLQIADYDRQKIVEVVGKSARQLADRLHLLGMAEPLLGRLALADVFLDGDVVGDFAVCITDRSDGGQLPEVIDPLFRRL